MDETYIEIWTTTHRSRKVRQSTEVVYKETLQKHLRASFSMTGTSILMQDGSPCHQAHPNSAWFAEKHDIKVLPWPGQSPDQNPIEQLFAILKWEVAKLPPATNREELKLRILQGWRNLGRRRDILRNLCNSMPRRVAALLDSQGGPTKY